jgi:indolepyruvate ferredoxin oxidoreductase beta subunit
MNNSVKSILFAGVGGQGVLVASDILSEVLVRSGLDTKQSEVHGVAQRGGSIVSHVRFGEKVYSPLGKMGDIDFLLAFEKLEALRYGHWVKDDGIIIVNDQKIMPTLLSSETREYPEEAIEFLKKKSSPVTVVQAYNIAKELENVKVLNIVLCGVISTFLDFDETIWKEVITEKVPSAVLDVNLEAFDRGRRIIGNSN